MERIKLIVISGVAMIVAGCATALPQGPSMMVLPAQGKPFSQFQEEDASCRNWAERSVHISPAEVQNNDTARGAAVGAVTGAGAGALLGSASGHMGAGAAIGTGVGLLMGTAVGADAGRISAHEAQRRYDIAYVQCMASHGNKIASQPGNVPPQGYYRRGRVIVVPADPPPVYYVAPPTPVYQVPPAAPPAPVYAPPAPAYPPPDTRAPVMR